MAPLLITAVAGLAAAAFRHGPVAVTRGTWTEVDADDPATRTVLVGYVGSHIQLFPGQDAKLAAADLELAGGRLLDLRAAKAAAAETTKKKTAKT